MARYIQRVHLIGGGGGNDFRFNCEDFCNNGSVLQEISVWAGASCLHGIQVTLSNGQKRLQGKMSGSHKGYTITNGQKTIGLSLWGNGIGTRCGGIKIRRSDGNVWQHKMTNWPLQTEYTIDVGSGIPVGIMGRSGWDVDCLGFVFLKRITTCRTTDVRLDLSGDGVAKKRRILSRELRNGTNLQQEMTFSASSEVEVVETCSNASGLEISTEASITMGPPMCSASGGVTVTSSETRTQGRSVRKREMISDNYVIRVPPFTTVRAKMICWEATFDVPYTPKVYTRFTDGTNTTTKTRGTYKGVSYSDAIMTYG